MTKYNNEQLSLFNTGDNSDDFFNKKRDWSASKHRVMLKYIQAFCYNLQSQSQVLNLNYVDGFAGEGKYNSGVGIKDFVETSSFWKKHQEFFLILMVLR